MITASDIKEFNGKWLGKYRYDTLEWYVDFMNGINQALIKDPLLQDTDAIIIPILDMGNVYYSELNVYYFELWDRIISDLNQRGFKATLQSDMMFKIEWKR